MKDTPQRCALSKRVQVKWTCHHPCSRRDATLATQNRDLSYQSLRASHAASMYDDSNDAVVPLLATLLVLPSLRCRVLCVTVLHVPAQLCAVLLLRGVYAMRANRPSTSFQQQQ